MRALVVLITVNKGKPNQALCNALYIPELDNLLISTEGEILRIRHRNLLEENPEPKVVGELDLVLGTKETISVFLKQQKEIAQLITSLCNGVVKKTSIAKK